MRGVLEKTVVRIFYTFYFVCFDVYMGFSLIYRDNSIN